jgi:protocatechuate 3,4-dioxygenase beta subunit
MILSGCGAVLSRPVGRREDMMESRGFARKQGSRTAGNVLAAVSAVLLACAAAAGPLPRAAAAPPKCPITPAGYMDPNYTPNPPLRSRVGSGTFVLTGIVRSGVDCAPLGHVKVEIWHAGPDGSYDSIHRGTVITDGAGRFRFETDFPGSSFGQPHIHVRVAVPGFKPTATVLLPKPGTKTGALEIVLEPEV